MSFLFRMYYRPSAIHNGRVGNGGRGSADVHRPDRLAHTRHALFEAGVRRVRRAANRVADRLVWSLARVRLPVRNGIKILKSLLGTKYS